MEYHDAPHEIRIQVVPVEGNKKYLAVILVAQMGVITGMGRTPIEAAYNLLGRMLFLEENKDVQDS